MQEVQRMNFQQLPEEQQPMTDLQAYQYILQIKRAEWRRLQPFPAEAAFFTHAGFKLAVMIFLYYQDFFVVMMQSMMLSNQIIIILVVIDFWFTKNYNGRKLIGITWSFQNDVHGVQRFCLQTRINQEFINRMHFRIFWLLQISYVMYPVVALYTLFHIEVVLEVEKAMRVTMQIIILVGGIINLFLFFKAYSCAKRRLANLKKCLGRQFITNFSKNSLICFL